MAVVVALAGLLSGCHITLEPVKKVFDPELSTNRQLIPDGPFGVCENLPTTVQFSATFDPGSPENGANRELSQVRQFFHGPETGVEYENHIQVEDMDVDENNRLTVTTDFSPDGVMAPLADASQVGTTLVRYEVFLRLGDTLVPLVWLFPTPDEDHVEVEGMRYYELPVWSNCSAD